MNGEPIIVRLKKSEYEIMLYEAMLKKPEEACGLVAGEDIDGIRYIKELKAEKKNWKS